MTDSVRKLCRVFICAAVLWISTFAIANAAGPRPAVDHGQRNLCVTSAAARYAVPVPLVYAVMRTEGGTTGKVSKANGNGSRDLGLMQVNEIHLPELGRLGITREMLIHDECVNIFIGTFILSRELNKPADFWTNVGAYNSRTPCWKFYQKGEACPNAEYQKKVVRHLIDILQGR